MRITIFLLSLLSLTLVQVVEALDSPTSSTLTSPSSKPNVSKLGKAFDAVEDGVEDIIEYYSAFAGKYHSSRSECVSFFLVSAFSLTFQGRFFQSYQS